MRRLHPLAALLLLALWLPVTLHCDAHAAGVAESPRCCSEKADQAVDACELAANTYCTPPVGSIQVPAPTPARVTLDWLETICVRLRDFHQVEQPVQGGAAFERPLDWVAAWRFVHRVAPPSRAPDRWLA